MSVLELAREALLESYSNAIHSGCPKYSDRDKLYTAISSLENTVEELRSSNERLQTLLNTPELQDFAKAVHLEACHQRERWGENHDAQKTPADWLWTLAYLATKAFSAHDKGDFDKAKHHTITAAALLNNWHSRVITDDRARTPITPSEEEK